jgi:hypothetical protein
LAVPKSDMPVVRRTVHAAYWLAAASLALSPVRAGAQTPGDAELASKLNNPLAAMITLPIQGNYDCCFGPLNGGRYTVNVQPVMPFALPDKWTLIVRTIVPLIHENRTSADMGAASGLGDTTQSFFFAPPSRGGTTLGVGPAFLWPTATHDLGSARWGAGPTFVLVEERGGGLTYGLLANHIWSYAEAGGRSKPNVSSTFIQPFASWTRPDATTLSVNTESSYNWEDGQWSIPVNVSVSHLFKLGSQRVQVAGGVKVYLARDAAPTADAGWGLRLTTTFLFPQ